MKQRVGKGGAEGGWWWRRKRLHYGPLKHNGCLERVKVGGSMKSSGLANIWSLHSAQREADRKLGGRDT